MLKRSPRRRLALSGLGPLAFAAALAAAGAAQAQMTTGRGGNPSSVTPAQAMADAMHGEASDPLERLNRKTYAFNAFIDRVAIRPLAVFWHHAAPRPIRTGINNFLSNLGEPLVFVNDVLQGRPKAAAGTAARFVTNSTVGLLGVIDVTAPHGLPHHDNGFGLTLGRWGVKSGPYLYLPILGPSSARDLVGVGVDLASNPLSYARQTGDGGLTTGLGIVGGLDARARADSDLKALEAQATDPYAALRSFYLQNRESEVRDGKLDLNALPDFADPESGKPPAGGQMTATVTTPAPAAGAPESAPATADTTPAPPPSETTPPPSPAPSPAPPKGV
jgi:phospholipid-binding lipoprotein MlaA